jgi:hypothetical protein
MHEIKARIQEILDSMNELDLENEIVEEQNLDESDDYPETYADIYVAIHNADGYYLLGSSPLGNRLINGFLLEATTLLRGDIDTIYVESGIDFVKATLACPDPETASYLLEDAAQINTILDLYNDALEQNGLPRMEVGIAVSLFEPEQEDEDSEYCEGDDCDDEDDEECACGEDCQCGDECECGEECDCSDECQCGEECDCGHEHGHHHHPEALDAFEYPVDYDNTAYNLAQFAGSESIDPIILSEAFYQFVSEVEEDLPYLATAFEEIEIEDLDVYAYHGNLTIEEN